MNRRRKMTFAEMAARRAELVRELVKLNDEIRALDAAWLARCAKGQVE